MSKRPTVSTKLAGLIYQLDEALRAEFGFNYQFDIIAMDRRVAARNTQGAARNPDRFIRPKERTPPYGPQQKKQPPEGTPVG